MADYSVSGNLRLKTELDIVKVSSNILGAKGYLPNTVMQYKNMAANLVTGFNSTVLLIERFANGISKVISPMDDMLSIVNRTKQAYKGLYDSINTTHINRILRNGANASYTDINTFGNVLARLSFVKPGLGLDNVANIAGTIMKAGYLGGTQPQELRSTVLQLMQGIGSNQLGGDELRSIRENAPGIVKYLTQGLRLLSKDDPTRYGLFADISSGNIKQFGESKLLTSDVVTAALKRVTDVVNEDFKQLTPTLQMSSNIIGNELINKVFNNGSPKFLEPIKEIVGDIAKTITEDNNGILQTVDNISQIVQTTLNSAKPVITGVGVLVGALSKIVNTTAGQIFINTSIASKMLTPAMRFLSGVARSISDNGLVNTILNRTLNDNVAPNSLKKANFNNAIFNNAQFNGANIGGFGGFSSYGPRRPFGGGPFVSPVEPIYSNYNDTSYRYWFDLSHRIGGGSYNPQLGVFPDDSYFNSSRVYEHFNAYKWSYFARAAGYYNASNFAKSSIGSTPLLTGAVGRTTYTDNDGNTFTADIVNDIDTANSHLDDMARNSASSAGLLSSIGSVLANPMTTFGISALIGTITAVGARISTNIQLLKTYGTSGAATMEAIEKYNSFLGSGIKQVVMTASGVPGFVPPNADVLNPNMAYIARKDALKNISEAALNNPEFIERVISRSVSDIKEADILSRFLLGKSAYTISEDEGTIGFRNIENMPTGISDILRRKAGLTGSYTLTGNEARAVELMSKYILNNTSAMQTAAKDLDTDIKNKLFEQIDDLVGETKDINNNIKTNYNKQKIDYMTNVASWYADKRLVGQKNVNVNGVHITIHTTSGDIGALTVEGFSEGLKQAVENSPLLA